MPQPNDLSRSPITLNQAGTLIAPIEMSRSSCLVAGIVPGIARHPLKKLAADAAALLVLLERWRGEATQAPDHAHRRRLRGRTRRVLAGPLAAGARDRSPRHSSDERGRLARAPAGEDGSTGHSDAERAFLGWLRGEPDHCTMA